MTGISDWQMNAMMWQAQAKELSEKLEQALAERDDARREVCGMNESGLRMNDSDKQREAKRRGWDCFKEKP